MVSEIKKQKNDFLRMALTLFAIAAVVAALLGLANYFTAPVIASSADERLQTSLKGLVTDAEYFSKVNQFEKKIVVDDKAYKCFVLLTEVKKPFAVFCKSLYGGNG